MYRYVVSFCSAFMFGFRHVESAGQCYVNNSKFCVFILISLHFVSALQVLAKFTGVVTVCRA